MVLEVLGESPRQRRLKEAKVHWGCKGDVVWFQRPHADNRVEAKGSLRDQGGHLEQDGDT